MDRKNLQKSTVKSTVKAQRQIRRNTDREHRKHHVSLVNRGLALDRPPPSNVVVMGPPGCGKTTLIRSLVKKYTKQNLRDVLGPCTVVSSKNQRLTFFECPNDMNAMIDLAKIADLVILIIDASFGFEMETFEFLNILQVHGFPKIIGVLTHLDDFRHNKRLQKTKKRLKQRFWAEIYHGAKLFYLSRVVRGRYPKMEVHNLARFIGVMKYRPLTWRNTHPFVLVDRWEDVTDPEKLRTLPKCDRTVAFYGYVRGSNLKPSMQTHIAGCGDYFVDSIEDIPDPCPLPEKESELAARRSLKRKDTVLYAPMANMGNVMLDRDAVYINLPSKGVNFTSSTALDGVAAGTTGHFEGDSAVAADVTSRASGVSLVRTLQHLHEGVGEQLDGGGGLQLVRGGTLVSTEDVSMLNAPRHKEVRSAEQEFGLAANSYGADSDGAPSPRKNGIVVVGDGEGAQNIGNGSDSDSVSSDSVDGTERASVPFQSGTVAGRGALPGVARWKQNMSERAAAAFGKRGRLVPPCFSAVRPNSLIVSPVESPLDADF